MMFDFINQSKRANIISGIAPDYMLYKNQTFRDEIKLNQPKVLVKSNILLIAAIA